MRRGRRAPRGERDGVDGRVGRTGGARGRLWGRCIGAASRAFRKVALVLRQPVMMGCILENNGDRNHAFLEYCHNVASLSALH